MPARIYFPMEQDPPLVSADVSVYQAMILPDGTIVSHFDFEQYSKKSRTIRLRGGVATAGIDFEYEYNLTTCESKCIYVDNVYHYTKLWKDLDSQAQIIKDTFDIAKGLAPTKYLNRLALDIETNDDLNKNTFTGNAEKLVNKVYGLTNVIPDIYTRAYFWNQSTYPATWMKNCGLWVAHHFPGINFYSVPIVRPYLPDAWADINNPIICFEWQADHYDNGADWGSTGDNEIDLNYFTYNGGTKAAWEDFYGVPYLEPTEPTPSTDDWREMIIDRQNMRNAPTWADTAKVGQGKKGKRVKVIGDKVSDFVPAEIWLYEDYLKEV